ncbi:hypothetical protein IAT38_007166 [Cryptococcus sp. DSM 104549]
MGGILGDDMGLGKTIQVISFLSAIMRKTGTAVDFMRRKKTIRQSDSDLNPMHWPTALIVCPKSLITNWSRELDTWGYFEYDVWRSETSSVVSSSFLKGFLDIVLVSYETAVNHIASLKHLPFSHISVVIADEAHRLKEPRSLTTLALKSIKCQKCFALTGTLVQNRLDEMWSVMDFVHRGWAGSQVQWKEFIVKPITKGHQMKGTAEEVVHAIRMLGLVHHKIMPHFYLRRDKRLIAHELPEKRDMIVFCPMARRQILAYKNLLDSEDIQFILRRNEMRIECCHETTSEGESLPQVLFKSMSALQKVANHLALLYHAADDSYHTRMINERIFKSCTGIDYSKAQHNAVLAAFDSDNCGKWKLLEELLIQWRKDTEIDNKVLIFSNSVRLLTMISRFIEMSQDLLGVSPGLLTGEVDQAKRMQMVDNFQDPTQDQFVMLISTMAGGVGLNLTAANKVVIFDPSWNPASDLQAMDRAFRIGQKRTVDVYRLIALGTLEELKYERQKGGFVATNLERVREAEDQFVQDLVEAEWEYEDMEPDQFDGSARDMRQERQARDMKRSSTSQEVDGLRLKAKRRENELVQEILGASEIAPHPKSTKDEDILASLGVNTHMHETAFSDSAEERAIFEIGVQCLQANPQLAKTIKANDLGKLALKRKRLGDTSQHTPHKDDGAPQKEEKVEKRRDIRGKVLAELSD